MKKVESCLMDGHHGCAKTIFTERSVLIFVTLILIVQLLNDRFAKHSVTFPMNEHDTLSFMLFVLLQSLAEYVELLV